MPKVFQPCPNPKCRKKGFHLALGYAAAVNQSLYGAATVTYRCRYCGHQTIIKPERFDGTNPAAEKPVAV